LKEIRGNFSPKAKPKPKDKGGCTG
jgi:hypothetical protein